MERMNRRAAAHDYTRQGVYHITIRVADGLRQPLGTIVGDVSVPEGSPDAVRTVLTPVGMMVEHELLHSISAHYGMTTVMDYVVMPDHLHFLLEVHDKIISSHGRTLPLGQVIAGFKKGCNKRYWEMTGQAGATPAGSPGTPCSGETAAHTASAAAGFPGGPAPVAGGPAPVAGGPASDAPVAGGPVTTYKVPSDGSTGRRPLFAPGFCDVMPVDAAQLATQRQYIKDNPRYRLLRSQHRDWLTAQRATVNTTLTIPGLRKYLRQVCRPWQATDEALAPIEAQLLVSGGGETAAHTGSAAAGFPGGPVPCSGGPVPCSGGPVPCSGGPVPCSGGPVPCSSGPVPCSSGPVPCVAPPAIPPGFIVCDSYGDRGLLARRLLPVVCHRSDAALFARQKARCLEAAAAGAVLVSPRIAPGEQDIIDEAVARGFPVVLVADNGFGERYHPSADRTDRCAAGRLLLVTPWRYSYRGRGEQLTVAFCKAMNCVAQALCRKKDSWWKE